MAEDILEESPFYQEILRRGEEKGRKEGLRQAQQELLQDFRQILVTIVQERFPQEAALIRLTKRQAAIIEKPEVLRRLIARVSALLTPDEVEKFLLSSERE